MQNQLVIGGYSIDTIEYLDINITKECYNIDDPSKRQSDFSKSVEIPGSKGNDFVFKSLFDVSFSIRNNTQLNPDFNPTKKAWCVYYQDTLPQINGYCQLNEIKVLNNNQVIYVVTIYGKNIDIFSKITDLKLNDLTTLGTATWDDTSIVNSWSEVFDPIIKLTYPMLDRGMSKFGRQYLTANGDQMYTLSYNYNAFKPFIYIKHIVDAIFSEAGVILEVANFFETDQFKKLILECDVTKFQANQSWIDSTLVDAYRNANQTLTLVSNSQVGSASTLYNTSKLTFNITNLDPAAQYDYATGTFTSGYQAYTNLNATLNIQVTKNESSSGVLTFQAIRKRGTTYKFVGVGSQTISGNATLTIVQNVAIDSTLLEVGDELRLVCTGYWTNGQPHNDYVSSIINQSGSTLRWYQDGQINYGQTFNIADILPEMKQTDFLMGIIKMFNLYMMPLYENSIVIEPRDDFYTNDVIDWTYKLDTSKDFVIKPQGLLENKEIVFSYADNGDDLSRNFQQSTTFNYGYLDLIFDNEFVKDTKKLELPFTIIPLQVEYDKNILMRTIYDGQPQEKSQKPIVAYFKPTSGKLRYWDNTTTTATNYTTIPYAGHIDDINNPSYDLAFSQQDFYYYTTPNTTGLKLTNNNLYNQFHKRQWEEIGDKDSKLVEAYFKLTPLDISQLDFRKKYWLNGNAYRLLSVQDYDPNENQTTLVKLLKLVEKNAIVPTVTTKNGGNGQGGTKVGSGEIDGSNRPGNVIKNGILNADTGNDINDTVVGVVITGAGNTLGGNNSNITILGHDNLIMPNVTDVVLINTSNQTITQSNVTYIDGVQYSTTKYYGAFHDTTSQFAASTTVNYPITFNHTDLSNGVSIGSPTSHIVFANAGTYNITWSVQYVNQSVQIHDTNIWMRLNGVDISNSNSKVSIPNSHGGVHGHNVTTINLMISVSANDYIQLVWNTNNTDVSIETIPAVTTPQTPESPSVILTVQQV